MKELILVASALVCLIATNSFAVDYSITKLIEVESASSAPFLGPLKWSPDGTKLAFFKGKTLMLTDTLGNVTTVKEINGPVHRYEWASNSLLAFHYRTYHGNKGAFSQLVSIDINNKRETVITEYMDGFGATEPDAFRGPLKSHKGSAFYETMGYSAKATGLPQTQRHIIGTTKAAQAITDDFVVPWEINRKVYKKFLDGRDSVFLCDKPGWKGAEVILSADQRFLISSDFLIDLSAGTTFDMQSISAPPPPNAHVCSFSYPSFNPKYPEALFHQSCEDDEVVISSRVAILNYESNDFLIFDTLVGLSPCAAPAFHTDGNIVAFFSGGNLYLAGLGRGTE